MKKLFTFLLTLLTGAAIAQCGNGSTLVAGSLTPPGVGMSTSLQFNSGQYVLAYVQGGANYQVSTCGGSTGGGPTYDTQLTVYADASGAFMGYNDDYCGLQSSINFTPSFCGYVRILLHQYSCNGSNLPWIVTMTQNTAGTAQTYTLSAVASQTNVTCFGLTNGRAEINVSGTTGAVRYNWAPSGGTNPLATGLAAGVYTVTATDESCNGAIRTYTITQPPALGATTSQTNVSCFGGTTGAASIAVSGGTTPYSYTWSPTGGNAALATGLSAGTYSGSITDANGCALSRTVSISQPTLLTSSAASGSLSCFGGSSATATVTAMGGTTPYTYLWSMGATTSVITGQTAGVKTVTVTDANGCTSAASVAINQPATAVASSTAITNVSCNGGNNGTATVTASGGTPGYTYAWSTAATTSVITNQTAGVKTVTVTDANGCSTTNSVTITQPTTLSAAVAVTTVACNGGSTGSATVSVAGGTPGYTYVWSTGAITPVISGQTSGVRTVTVTDANGCVALSSGTITQPATGLSATQSQTNVTCVINGRAAVTVSGGTAPYTYTWVPAGGNAATSTTLAPGSYTAAIRDANNCNLASLFTITANTVAPVLAVSGSTAICNGGSANLSVSGANTYTWSTGATTTSISVSPTVTTTYSVTGTTTANGCTASASRTLIVNPIPTVTATASNATICTTQSTTLTAGGASTYTWSTGSNATSIVVSPTTTTTYTLNGNGPTGCFGSNTITINVVNTPTVTAVSSNPAICAGSSATLTANGATTYSWSTGATTSTIVVSPASTSTYSVNGMVSAGCNSNAVVSVTVNALPTLSISVTQATVCAGQTSTLTASGASTYTWSTGSNATSITSTPVVATTYTVTGTNAAGCRNTATQSIGLFPAPSINLTHIGSPSASVCAGLSSTLSASGVSTYTWSTGSNNTSIQITPATTTTYSVNGTDVNGCTATASITIGISANPTVTAVASSTGICNGFSSNLTASGASTYTWSTGAQTANTTVNPSVTTIYGVTGTNAAGCVASVSVQVTVYVSPTVSIGADVDVPLGTTHQFNPSQNGATSYTWTPATYLSSASVLNPVSTPESDITYVLTVGSVNGCTASDTVMVKVLTELVIANYMSPNGDGQNDTWKVNTPGLIKDYSVTIIDSYGKTVFSVDNNYNNEFDGKLGGQDLPDGVYYYFIRSGNDTKFKGNITLTK